MAGTNTIQLTAANFEAMLVQPVALVDFWAPWCGPCRMVGPIVDELADDYAGKVSVGKLNVDEESQLAARYGVMTIPTLLVFQNGKEVERLVGMQSKAALGKLLDQYL